MQNGTVEVDCIFTAEDLQVFKDLIPEDILVEQIMNFMDGDLDPGKRSTLVPPSPHVHVLPSPVAHNLRKLHRSAQDGAEIDL